MANSNYTFFLENPEDRPPREIPQGFMAGGPPPDMTLQDTAPLQEPQDQAQPPVEPNPFFTNVTPNPRQIVEACVATRREEEREKLPTRISADEAWDRYHGRYDFSDKEDWQSKKISPKLSISVERLVATLARLRETSSDWFTIEAVEERAAVYYNLVKHLMQFYLEHDEVNFDRIFRWSLKCGLLYQMAYVLVVGETDGEIDIEPAGVGVEGAFSTPSSDGFANILALAGGSSDTLQESGPPTLPNKSMWKPRLEVLNPDYVYLDSTGRDRYIIWELRYHKGEAKREGEIRGWDMEALERALANPVSVDDTADTLAGFHEARDAAKQDKVPDYKAYSKVKITNYFGDLYDPNTGDLLLENQYFIIANDKELVYGPVDNPFWDGYKPIVAAPIIEVPFAAYGRSPIVWNLDMFDLWNEYLNLLVDYMQSVLLGMKEVDIDLLEDEDDLLRSGIYPGKMVRTTKGGQPNVQAILNVPFSDVPQGFWQHMQILQKELSDNVLLSDTIGGQPRTRGRITALEFNRRAADAGAMIDYVFRSLEDNLLAPIIRLLFYRILQFMPQKMWADWVETHKNQIMPNDPQSQQIFKKLFDEIKSWSPQQRFRELGGYFKFKVRVFSALADRQMEIEKGALLLQTVSQIPVAAQFIRWPVLLRYIIRAYGWDPEEILSKEAIPLPPEMLSVRATPPQSPIEPGKSMGAPTNISTSPPFAPSSPGVPGSEISNPTGPGTQG